ncbi:MAG: PEP-CTERM sorting domain-containing protein [Akkermansiaceae bacterium]|nr:PEP-CTERM sorting domain-containing protein [Akkermansiaceae bacterium]
MKTCSSFPTGFATFVLPLSTLITGSASAVTWTLENSPGTTTYRPGSTPTAQLPDTATEDHNALRTSGSTSSVRVVNSEGITDGIGTTERFSGRGFFYDEAGPSSGRMSIVSKTSYNLANEKIEMDMFNSLGHVPRLISEGQNNQIIQIGLMDISGGTSDKYFGDNSVDALYLSFVADSNVKLDWNDTVASDGGDTGSITGDFTIRNESGAIVASLATGVQLDATTYLGGGVGDNIFSTELYWYNMNLTFEEDGVGGIDISFDVHKYSNISDIGWRTQQIAGSEQRLTPIEFNMVNATTNIAAGSHGLSSFATLAPALGTNVSDSLYLGTSGINYDWAPDLSPPVQVPEPTSGLLIVLGSAAVCFRRNRSQFTS